MKTKTMEAKMALTNPVIRLATIFMEEVPCNKWDCQMPVEPVTGGGEPLPELLESLSGSMATE